MPQTGSEIWKLSASSDSSGAAAEILPISAGDNDKDIRGTERNAPRYIRAFLSFAVILIALLSAISSFFILMGLTPLKPDRDVTYILTYMNAFMVFCLLAGIGATLSPIIKSWRARRAASRLHVRIIALFSLVAAVPALVIAIVAAFTLNIGLDRWFDINTRQIVASSVNLANAYAGATLQSLQTASYTMAMQLDNRRLLTLNRPEYIKQLTLQANGRDLLGVFLLKKDGSVIVSSNRGDEENLPIPPQNWINEATLDHPVAFQPGAHSYFGVILKMDDIDDAWLYAVRETDPRVLEALRLTEINTNHYRELEENRVPAQIAFSVLYVCLFLIMLLSAIWAGIAVADRLVRPIRRLIRAADDVARGNLRVQVPVYIKDGDVGQLARTFNYMVEQLNSQRNDLIAAGAQIDERRRFSEAVLSGVSSAVIGIDGDGFITIINRSAEHMFGLSGQEVIGKSLTAAVHAEIGNVFEIARALSKAVHREQITIKGRGSSRVFNIQITMEDSVFSRHFWVVTIDDITNLVEAQRSSAWADVARRIAHEIKNPLTPIQLSAERIRRRFGGRMVEEKDKEIFDRCTETIIRQVGDIGRMVDEFSSFARMPKPNLLEMDIREPLRDAIFLIEVSRSDIIFERKLAGNPLIGAFDGRLISQAFGNVIKNAGEAIDVYHESAVGREKTAKGCVKIEAYQKNDKIIVDIIDNGKGLPKKERQKLLEPYMTMREKGTGLGLAIVRKIVEEHGGQMELLDAPPDFFCGRGAMVRMIFPVV